MGTRTCNSWVDIFATKTNPRYCVFVLVGFVLDLSGLLTSRKAKTTLSPFAPGRSTSIVQSRPYRFIRNPMYLGMSSVLPGLCRYFANPLTGWSILVFVACITRFQIIPEERLLLLNSTSLAPITQNRSGADSEAITIRQSYLHFAEWLRYQARDCVGNRKEMESLRQLQSVRSQHSRSCGISRPNFTDHGRTLPDADKEKPRIPAGFRDFAGL